MAVDTRPTTLTAIHNYNLRNQGWPTEFYCSPNNGGDGGPILTDPVPYTYDTQGWYPSNSDIIYFAKLAASVRVSSLDSYSPWQLDKEIFGNTPAPKGHFIINAFDRNRQTVSNIDAIYDESRDKEEWRPIATAFYAGRIWYLMQTGVLYFSQTLTEIANANKCYQEADPTAADINDLVATDGGKIDIAGIAQGLSLIPVRAELVVLANNGVWTVSGTAEGGFQANDQEIRQITNVGVIGKETVVEAEGVVYYWSRGGIYALAQDQVNGFLQQQNISEQTIQTLYLDIPESGKEYARGFYDEQEKKIFWFYNDEDTYDGTNFRYRYNKVLVLDLLLQAFYTYSMSVTSDPFVAAFIQKKASSFDTVTEDVTDSSVVVTDSAVDVTDQITESTTNTEVKLKLLTFAETSTDTYQYTFSEFKSNTLYDWITFNGGTTGTDFSSYLETGHDIMEDLISEKEANTVYTFFKRTEQNLTDNGTDLVFDFPSSCFLRAKWHWSDSVNSGRWSDEDQIYRLQNFLPVEAGAFDYGYDVIQTVSQVRGKGRALSLRFRSETGKDFHLLGWSIPATLITGY